MKIYLDHASGTPMDKTVVDAMLPYLSDIYGNPSSNNDIGGQAKWAVENARHIVSKILNCNQDEIIFTSGGTESINLAIHGIAKANKTKGKHIISIKIEHSSVIKTLEYLRDEEGYIIDYVDINNYGQIDFEDLKSKIKKDTILITIGYANNEIGTIQDVRKIGQIAREHNIYFHTDACQAAGALELDAKANNIDLMTLNGSKIYGPKGIGILYVRHGIMIKPIMYGGNQERGLRPGTENVACIVGFSKALELAEKSRQSENKRLCTLRDKFIQDIKNNIPDAVLNGHPKLRLPNNINISIPGVESESLLHELAKQEIYASPGSACNTGTLEPSYVILAIGVPLELAYGTIRFSLGKFNKEEDLVIVAAALKAAVINLRKNKKSV